MGVRAYVQTHAHTLKRQPCTCAPGNMHRNVHSSNVHNSKNLETTEISTSRRTDKPWCPAMKTSKPQLHETYTILEEYEWWGESKSQKNAYSMVPFLQSSKTIKMKHYIA